MKFEKKLSVWGSREFWPWQRSWRKNKESCHAICEVKMSQRLRRPRAARIYELSERSSSQLSVNVFPASWLPIGHQSSAQTVSGRPMLRLFPLLFVCLCAIAWYQHGDGFTRPLKTFLFYFYLFLFIIYSCKRHTTKFWLSYPGYVMPDPNGTSRPTDFSLYFNLSGRRLIVRRWDPIKQTRNLGITTPISELADWP